VSNDNPYSEAWNKTLKYAPVFPERFGCLADARDFLTRSDAPGALWIVIIHCYAA
jgi:hypothetical protein